MSKVDAKTLLEAGVHFGHRTDKWNPKMKPFIYEARNGIHIINLNETAKQLDKASDFLKTVASKGGKVLFVGTKKAAQEAVKQAAAKSNSFYVTERWLGGTLTNLNTIRKSVSRMREIDEMDSSGKLKSYGKQEISALRRESAKIHRNLDGIADMTKYPDAIVIIDVSREDIAVLESKRLSIPIIGITDTNADPEVIQYPVAANDDAIRSIRILLDVLSAAVIEGNAAAPRKADKGKESKAKETKVEKEITSPEVVTTEA